MSKRTIRADLCNARGLCGDVCPAEAITNGELIPEDQWPDGRPSSHCDDIQACRVRGECRHLAEAIG